MAKRLLHVKRKPEGGKEGKGQGDGQSQAQHCWGSLGPLAQKEKKTDARMEGGAV